MSTCSLIPGFDQDDMAEWCTTLTFVARLVAYVAALALLVIIIFMIMRYIEDFEESRSLNREVRASSETQPLLWPPEKASLLSYGTCDQIDLESGKCSSSSSSSSNNDINITSSEDLYDGKICIICFDEQRNCFFVPCGHSATCYVCADRIFHGENRTCPVCRRFIGRVRKLFAA